MQKAGSSDGYQFYIHQIICFGKEGRWPTDMFNTANPSNWNTCASKWKYVE